jgi:5-formyltetrahydrofolate cyclo-ligase
VPHPSEPNQDRVAEEKAALRTRLRAMRDAIPPTEQADKAGRIEERLMSLDAVRLARTLLVFYAFGSEVATRNLMARLLEEGRRVLLPYMDAEGIAAAEVRPGDALVETTYGPKEPSRRVAVDPTEIDLVVVPGLAFDREGYRVGYGGGAYDRYLTRLRSNATKVGIAFHAQVVESVPRGPGDQPVDLVVTEREVISR